MRKIFFLCACVFWVASKAQQPAYPIVRIPLKIPATPPTVAQAKDRLFWYSGKKINDSMLITTGSTIVLFSKKYNSLVVQPDPKRDPTLKMVQELDKNEQRKDQFYAKMSERTINVMWYPAIINTFFEFDHFKESYGSILKNTIQLPKPLIRRNAGIKSVLAGGGASVSKIRIFYAGVPIEVKRAYEELMNSMKNYPPIDFAAPPTIENGSCLSGSCDSTARKKIVDNEKSWIENFKRYEAGIIEKSMVISTTIREVDLDDDAEAKTIVAGVQKAIEFAQARLTNKVDLLIRKYGKDFTRLSSIIKVAISIERERQLLGHVGKDTYSATMLRLLNLFDGYEQYIEQQMDARNYDVVFNIPFVMGMVRQHQLLGAGGDNNNEINSMLDKIALFNRFKIEVDMIYNGRWNDCGERTENFHAKSRGDNYLSMGLINCRYNFFLPEDYIKSAPNYHFGRRYNIELEVMRGTTVEVKQTEDNKCITKSYDLTGLKVRPYAPFISISFCKEGGENDSLEFSGMHLAGTRENRYEERYGVWKLPQFDVGLRNDGYVKHQPPDELFIQAEKTEAEFRNHQMKAGIKPNLAEMDKHYNIAAQRETVLKAIIMDEEQHNPSPAIFDAKNGDEILVDETITKEYSENGDGYVEGGKATFRIKIKITHDPLPYKKKPKQ